ncbi:MAG: LysM peptidoglycan-binding domain-containing protein [Phycisphaerae bacterium]|nr:LysM peptidoglycan-binding domain-containing protein [Phycisphaerae bacterium]
MRTDVKFGIVLGLLVLAGMSWYFLQPEEGGKPLRLVDANLASQRAGVGDDGSPLPPPLISVHKAQETPGAKKPKPRTDTPRPRRTRPAPTTNGAARTTTSPSLLAQAGANRRLSVDDILKPSKSGTKTKSGLPLITPPGTELPKKAERQESDNDKASEQELAVPVTPKPKPKPEPLPILPDFKKAKPTSLPADRFGDTPRPKPVIEIPEKKKPEEPKERFHEVKANDSFAILAEKYYGSQRFAELLLKANPQVKEARLLKVGAKLRIPPMSELINPKKESDANKTAAATRPDKPKKESTERPEPAKKAPEEKFYIVKANDSFYSIAREVWGNGGRWRELHAMNKSVCADPESLRPGMKLRITPQADKKTPAKR